MSIGSINSVPDIMVVSRKFSQQMTASNQLWRQLFLQKWPNQNQNVRMKSWYNAYRLRVKAAKKVADTEPVMVTKVCLF
jgi:hypothetical protein